MAKSSHTTAVYSAPTSGQPRRLWSDLPDELPGLEEILTDLGCSTLSWDELSSKLARFQCSNPEAGSDTTSNDCIGPQQIAEIWRKLESTRDFSPACREPPVDINDPAHHDDDETEISESEDSGEDLIPELATDEEDSGQDTDVDEFIIIRSNANHT
ncbi:hypothetical protein D9615_007215 [Tricholomella constricta]|uniref:Uncharacterized protein n=1 Tax=Tricholomella constricta TaxID=117010 RepID=A0A8H5M1B3_9AGAR|nr:hypothetical protein D9615_007215 [Tricholomella constricta]